MQSVLLGDLVRKANFGKFDYFCDVVNMMSCSCLYYNAVYMFLFYADWIPQTNSEFGLLQASINS